VELLGGNLLVLGFLVGMRHALEADHVAALASLATGSRSVAETTRQGLLWGLGHTFTLFLFGGAVLVLDSAIPERLASALELAVGVMLVLLGAEVLWRLVRDRVHFHRHSHHGLVHLHAHSHSDARPHDDAAAHRHRHAPRLPLRALLVGMMHGMAGSAALILLTLGTARSPLQGLAYIALFGLGSMVGMAVLAAAIGLPLRFSARRLTWAHNGLKGLVGGVTVGLGGLLIYRTGFADALLF